MYDHFHQAKPVSAAKSVELVYVMHGRLMRGLMSWNPDMEKLIKFPQKAMDDRAPGPWVNNI